MWYSETGGRLSLRYKIKGNKIDGVSIKLGIAQDDAWSKTCKFMLTCCKVLLAHASNVNVTNGRRCGKGHSLGVGFPSIIQGAGCFRRIEVH